MAHRNPEVPQLTSTGAFRAQNSGNQGPHNGFYTQQELQELINYAARKHIEIIPELDIPGHTVAAILAYPGLGCKNKDSIPIIPGKPPTVPYVRQRRRFIPFMPMYCKKFVPFFLLPESTSEAMKPLLRKTGDNVPIVKI